jgi:tRNA pseudouridine38-40 synthase
VTSPEAALRIRLDLAYDGTDFTGWARQPGLRTVQGVLEDALATLFGRTGVEPPRLTVAGRTDVGVHAIGQVAHLDLAAEHLVQLDRRPHGRGAAAAGAASLARRINGIVGPAADVQILPASEAPEGLDARFSAVWRRYEYRIADAEALRDPRTRAFTLWHSAALDADAMDAAARGLLGLHDFAAYCRPRDGATTIRTLQEFGWRRDVDGVLVANVRADAFCHSMVRALVGACVAAGEGRFTPERAAGIRDEAQRGSEFIVLPSRGLTLVEVGYPPDAELAARAQQTRAKRVAGGLPDEAPID